MGMQSILPITVSVKKIKGASRQRSVVTLGVDELLVFRTLFWFFYVKIMVLTGLDLTIADKMYVVSWFKRSTNFFVLRTLSDIVTRFSQLRFIIKYRAVKF